MSNFKLCNRCQRKLNINCFEKYSGERGKKDSISSRSSICKDCRSDLRLINLLKKKYYIVKKLFNGKCCYCDVSYEFLPSFEFHHLNPNLKSKTWTNIKHQSAENIEKWIKNEKVILLCSNCHELIKAKYFNDFQDLILNVDLFKNSPEKIDEMINKSINNHQDYKDLKEYKRNIKIQVKKFIRKRFVFNELFSGKCVGCKKSNTYNILPILELHHRNPENQMLKSTWRDIANLDCISIIENIKKEDCICLCSNCHILINSKINLFLNEVIGDKQISKLLKMNYERILSNIHSFNLNFINFELKKPLNFKLSQKNFWKLHLLKILILLDDNKGIIFKVNDLKNQFNHKLRSIRSYLDRLIKLNYLKKFKEPKFPFKNYYTISNLGYKILEAIKENHYEIYQKLKKNINHMEYYMKRQNKWIEQDDNTI